LNENARPELIKTPNFMKIEQDTAVTLTYKVTDPTGKLLDQSKEPMAYLHGGYDNIFPKVEAALQGQEAGYSVTLDLTPEDAFGPRVDTLVQTISKKHFPPGVKVGGQLSIRSEDGHEHAFTVMKIKGDAVHLDGNHPLAGQALRFTATVTEVRAASAEEIAHKHVHGAHGHHH
jgi:FKBP-type peptidyl-prolyl cis-trans isomerase SlyD